MMTVLSFTVSHRGSISQSIDIQAYKNTITPAYSALRYSEAYVLYKHAKSYNKATVPMPKDREKLTPYQKRLADSIIKLSAGLPIKPMAEISGREVAEFIKSNNLTDDNVRELRNFWMYCRDRGVYSGGNPFPETKSSKRTRQGAMRGAFVANELSDDQIDESFELIMQHPGGENCAVGLQLWAGLDVKTVVALRWKDVVFHDNADFTTIILLQNDNAGATHIYTRPILPQASRMLHMMHDIATECEDNEEVNESFVVCKDNGKPFTADEIVKSTKRFIKNLDKDNRFSTMKGTAVAMSTRIMNNTYRGILIRKCGLTDDTYTFKFLCGESLSTDVSSDHYISFTDKDAQARLFALLKVAGPVQSFQNRMEEIDEGEYVRYRIYPPTTAHTAVLNAKLVFENAESFTIESEHGVTGDLTVRRIDENGKKKRKPRKKKITDGQNDNK
ncbi:MAG: hypothetical protein IJP43_03430 [Oscillospiraceae bacterium]|nr:hypothetical protein [Oscillospiraceae bacterium]